MSLNVGVIGCGPWGFNYLRVLHETRECNVLSCSDVSRERLDGLRDRFPLLNTTLHAGDLIADPKLDALVIATPAVTHHELAIEALDAGKHVLIEKPLAIDVAQCEAILAARERSGRTLMVGHTFLYNNSVRKVKEIMGTPGFGKPYYLCARRNNLGPIREDVSAIWDLAPHDISIFNYLLDASPTSVSATAGSFLKSGHHDVAFITLTYPDNVLANIQVSWVDSNKIREVVAIGSQSRVVFDDINVVESVRIYEKGVMIDPDSSSSYGEFQYLLRDGDIRSPKVDKREPLKVLVEEFLDAVRKGERPLSDGALGLEVVRVLAACEESIRQNGLTIETTSVTA